MPRRKQVQKITYPNGKIYVGMDLTGTLLYMGSPSADEQIAADLGLEPGPFDVTLRKETVSESETATDAEVRAMEVKLIRETGAQESRRRLHQAASLSSGLTRKAAGLTKGSVAPVGGLPVPVDLS